MARQHHTATGPAVAHDHDICSHLSVPAASGGRKRTKTPCRALRPSLSFGQRAIVPLCAAASRPFRPPVGPSRYPAPRAAQSSPGRHPCRALLAHRPPRRRLAVAAHASRLLHRKQRHNVRKRADPHGRNAAACGGRGTSRSQWGGRRPAAAVGLPTNSLPLPRPPPLPPSRPPRPRPRPAPSAIPCMLIRDTGRPASQLQ